MGVFSPSGSSGFGSGGSSVTNSISAPVITHVSCLLANTEYSYALPTGTKFFRMKIRDSLPATLHLAFVATQSGTTNITQFPGFTYESPSLPLDSSLTVYFQCTKASQTVEIESWS